MATNDVSAKRRENTQRPYLGNSQMHNELSNPCIKEQELSRKCLDDNNYDKDSCKVYFINYQNCRAFWNRVIRERRSKGLMPYLPLPEDRAEIKAKWFDSKR